MRALGFRDGPIQIDRFQVRRLLVIRLDEIGDVVLTSPFFRELRCLFRGAWITLVVKPDVFNLVEYCPYVDEVLIYDWEVPGRLSRLRRHARALMLSKRWLWRRRFDVAIVPRWDADYYHAAFLAYFSGARCRVGFSEHVTELKEEVNAGFDCLYTSLVDDRTPKHELLHNLDLVRFLGDDVRDESLELWLGKEDEAFVEETFRAQAISKEDYLIAACPGAGRRRKVWPPTSFAELARWLASDFRARILILGGPEVSSLGEQLRRETHGAVINMAGLTTLRQTAALLKRCHLYLGNDTGPMHLAAAAGVPVIGISCHPQGGPDLHSNSPVRFGPWRVRHVILQPKTVIPPCRDTCTADEAHCILGVDVDRVREAIRSMLPKEFASPIRKRPLQHQE